MKYFTHIGRTIRAEAIMAELEDHPELWDQNGLRKEMQPHAQMSDIWLRYNDKTEFEKSGDWSKFNDPHDAVWYPAYYQLHQAKEFIFDLMRLVEGERLGGVLITKIPPGSGIAPHKDGGWHVEHYDKYYLSLKSSPGARFYCGDEFINPKVGDIWKFDNKLEHWVENKSSEDRVTLIVCIRSDRGTAT